MYDSYGNRRPDHSFRLPGDTIDGAFDPALTDDREDETDYWWDRHPSPGHRQDFPLRLVPPVGGNGLQPNAAAYHPDRRPDRFDMREWERTMSDSLDRLSELASRVGGLAELRALDDEPLPDEPAELDRVSLGVRDRMIELLEMTDEATERFCNLEIRTALRRALVDAAAIDPKPFAGTAALPPFAHGLINLAATANRLPTSKEWKAEVRHHFDRAPNAMSRAERLLFPLTRLERRASHTIWVGRSRGHFRGRHLSSAPRRWLVKERDLAIEQLKAWHFD